MHWQPTKCSLNHYGMAGQEAIRAIGTVDGNGRGMELITHFPFLALLAVPPSPCPSKTDESPRRHPRGLAMAILVGYSSTAFLSMMIRQCRA